METRETLFNIPGMCSNHCAAIIKRSLNRLPGVEQVDVSLASHRVKVRFDPSQERESDLRRAVEKAGYEITGIPGGNGQATVRLQVPGMGSDHCAGIVGKSLQRVKGVERVRTHLARHQVEVVFDRDAVSVDQLRESVEKAGYEVTGVTSEEAEEEEATAELDYLARARRHLWIAMLPTIVIMILMAVHMFWTPIPGYLGVVALLALPVVFIAGADTHRSALRSLLNRTANMDVLISMGSLPPYLIGLVGFFYPMTSFIEMAATIMSFHLLGRFLETRAKGRASQAIQKLLHLGAKTARVERDGEEVEVPIKELQPGAVMVVRPGERVPTDGEIIEGDSHVDESLATGESVPVEKGPGDPVLGATINKEGMLRVRATKVGKDTFLSQVVKLVEEAQGSKVPIQEFADRVTGYFVPAVLMISIGSFLVWLLAPSLLMPVVEWGAGFLPWVNPELSPLFLALLAGIAVLVISCPCALGLATPTALMVGSGMGAERGILIRSGEAIQTFRDVRLIVLDKTGTVTKGEPSLTDLWAAEGFTDEELLRVAAAVEAGSEHPLGQAIVAAAKERKIDLPAVKQFRAVTARAEALVGNRKFIEEAGISAVGEPGEGGDGSSVEELEGQGKTVMLVAHNGRFVGLVAVADTVKEDSQGAIAALKDMGIHPVMVTGDNERTARHVAEEVGIDEVHAGVLPEGKVDRIRELQRQGRGKIAMVGDGINDAPALKQADIGVAIGAGADVTIEAADVTLVKGELTKVVEAIRLSRSTFRKIVQNLSGPGAIRKRKNDLPRRLEWGALYTLHEEVLHHHRHRLCERDAASGARL